MRITQLAFLNFKSSFKNYLSLIISLAFTISVFLNFQNIIYSDAFDILGERNKYYIDMLVEVVSFVLGCFSFFFIWYSTNVFLTKRKREIGIYVFMGLSNQKIGKLYAVEITWIGLISLGLGIAFGSITTGLFQMMVAAISDVTVNIQFEFRLLPILITTVVYAIVYLIFTIKGYVNIVRSSVLNMISAAKQNEYVRQKSGILVVRAILGVTILCSGYYLAIKEGGQEVMGNVFAATALVVAGVYLLFGGLIPLIFQMLARNKGFLYQKQRCLWVNNVIFRMKKNYRTYAMVCVLVLCSVTALATGFALKYRYDTMIQFRNTYTFQVVSDSNELEEKITSVLQEVNEIIFDTQTPVLRLDASEFEPNYAYENYMLIPYSYLKQLAADAGLELNVSEPSEDEIITLSHVYLLSFYTDRSFTQITIHGKTYQEIGNTNVPFLGYLQESNSYYVLNDKEYEKLIPLGNQLYTYNYRIENLDAFGGTREALNAVVEEIRGNEDKYVGLVAISPENNELSWTKVLYSLCIFMFLVFVLASGSIMFMKLYNDAYEEKERYLLMQKMGFGDKILKKSVVGEMRTAYGVPFMIMGISSYFSVHALGKMMHTNLLSVNLVSVLIVFGIFLVFYMVSVVVYQRNVGVR